MEVDLPLGCFRREIGCFRIDAQRHVISSRRLSKFRVARREPN